MQDFNSWTNIVFKITDLNSIVPPFSLFSLSLSISLSPALHFETRMFDKRSTEKHHGPATRGVESAKEVFIYALSEPFSIDAPVDVKNTGGGFGRR